MVGKVVVAIVGQKRLVRAQKCSDRRLRTTSGTCRIELSCATAHEVRQNLHLAAVKNGIVVPVERSRRGDAAALVAGEVIVPRQGLGRRALPDRLGGGRIPPWRPGGLRQLRAGGDQ